nr:hypothetical protein [Tanacetum cinerariifolium]
NLDIPEQVSKAVDEIVTDAIDWAIQALLRNRFRDLPEADIKEILHQRMWETNSYKAHEDHMMLYEALEKSMNCPSRTLRSPGASGSSQLPPPPSPPSTSQSDQSKSTYAPSSSKTTASAEYTAWTTTDTRLKTYVSSIPEDLHMDDDMAPDEQPLEEDRHATPELAWSIPSSDLPVPTNNYASALAQGITELKPQDLEGPTFELVKVFHPNVIHLQYQMEECHKLLTDIVDQSIIKYNVSKPLPLGGPPEECKYDIAAMYGISHWWFQRQRFYINKHTSEGDRRAVRTHMWILSELKSSPCMGHLNHLPPKDKNILTTAVNLWTRHLVIRQRIEDFQLRIESYQTQLNLTKPRWDATGFEYKHDFAVIDSPRAVTFRDKYGVQMIMRWQSAPAFDHLNQNALLSLEPRDHLKISLGHHSIILASLHTMKSKSDIKSPTHYLRGIAKTSE